MSIMDAIMRAEDLVTSTRDVASLALTVQEVLDHGYFAHDSYVGAINVLVEKSEAVRDQANAAIEGLYQAMRDHNGSQ